MHDSNTASILGAVFFNTYFFSNNIQKYEIIGVNLPVREHGFSCQKTSSYIYVCM